MNQIEFLPVNRLLPHPDNPRKDLGDLTELTESVRENGILQNLTVVPADQVERVTVPDGEQPFYVVIIGHRRLAAAKAAGLETVPCIVTGMDRKTQLSTMLMENVQRIDLTPYEQAQGFHQLALLGLNVAQISKQSGFSKKVVKSRLEMAQLNQETLKKVSNERQISLKDFDRLAQIKDITLRNSVLMNIGTRDFDEALAKAKKKELIACKMPAVKGWLEEHNAKPLPKGQQYSSRYTACINNVWRSSIYIDRLGESGNCFPPDEDVQGLQLYYVLTEQTVSVYIERPDNSGRTVHGQKTEAEKARDRVMREVRAKIKEFSALHYGLRKDFIEGLTVTKANRDKIVAGALMPALYFAHCSGANKSDTIDKLLGYERSYEYHTDKVLAGLDGLQEKDLARAVYAIYNDNAENWFADDMNTSFTIPNYDPTSCNIMLQLLYRWMESLGYEPSTEEQALRDGSHEIYRRGNKKK